MGAATSTLTRGYWATFPGTGHADPRLKGWCRSCACAPIVRQPELARWRHRARRREQWREGWRLRPRRGRGNIRTFSQGVNPPAGGSTTRRGRAQDMARGIAVLPDGTGGYVVNKTGKLSPILDGYAAHFHPRSPGGLLWPGRDMARGVAVLADGSGGYVLGRNGTLTAFAIGTNPRPPAATGSSVVARPGHGARGVTAPFVDDQGVAGGWIADSVRPVSTPGARSSEARCSRRSARRSRRRRARGASFCRRVRAAF